MPDVVRTRGRDNALTNPAVIPSLGNGLAGLWRRYPLTGRTHERVHRLCLFSFLFLLINTPSLHAATIQEIQLNPGENVITTAVIDPAGDAAYFATAESDFRYSMEVSSATIVQVGLSDFRIRQRMVLAAGQTPLQGAVIDPRRHIAYFGVYGDPNRDVPGQILHVSLDPLGRTKAFTLPKNEFGVSSGLLSPNGNSGYFGTLFGSVVGLHLPDMTLIGSLGLQREDNAFQTSVLDITGAFAYFGTATGNVTKIRLSDFTPLGNITVLRQEAGFRCAFLDSASGDTYFGTEGSPAKLVRLSDLKSTGEITLKEGQSNSIAGFCLPGSKMAYLVCAGPPAQVIKIQLRPMKVLSSMALPDTIGKVRCAVFDAKRQTLLLGAGTTPGRIARVSLESL